MDTWTAERTFALKMKVILLITVNTHISLSDAFIFLRAAIHCAVRVFTGEADEIAAQSLCGFCGKILKPVCGSLLRPLAAVAKRLIFMPPKELIG